MKLEKIKKKIKERGIKHNFIANKLKITPTAFGRKIKGKNFFTINELKELSKILELNDKEKLEFFLK